MSGEKRIFESLVDEALEYVKSVRNVEEFD